MEIGSKLKNARKENGITQEHAAELLDVSRQTISNWENNKSYSDIISVIKMSDKGKKKFRKDCIVVYILYCMVYGAGSILANKRIYNIRI